MKYGAFVALWLFFVAVFLFIILLIIGPTSPEHQPLHAFMISAPHPITVVAVTVGTGSESNPAVVLKDGAGNILVFTAEYNSAVRGLVLAAKPGQVLVP